MARSKHTVEQKLAALQMVEEAEYTLTEICSLYSISEPTLKSWKIKYETEGIEGLKLSTTWKSYSKELKNLAVRDFLENRLTILKYLKNIKLVVIQFYGNGFASILVIVN